MEEVATLLKGFADDQLPSVPRVSLFTDGWSQLRRAPRSMATITVPSLSASDPRIPTWVPVLLNGTLL